MALKLDGPTLGLEKYFTRLLWVTFHWWLWAPVNVWWLRPLQKTHRNDLGVGVGCFGDFCCSKIMINNQKTQEVCWIKKTSTSCTLRIIGPSYRGVWICIAGFRDLQSLSFEIPWFLGYSISFLEIVLTDLPGISTTPFFCPRPNPESSLEGYGKGVFPLFRDPLGEKSFPKENAAMNSAFPAPRFLFRPLRCFFFNAKDVAPGS